MSNAALIARIERTLERFAQGDASASEVEEALVRLHVPAMDRTGVREQHEANCLVRRLIEAGLASPPVYVDGAEVTFGSDEPVLRVVEDLRPF